MSKTSVYFTVGNLHGKHQISQLKRELDAFHGVISVSVNDQSEEIAVDFDTTGVKQEQIRKKIEELGYNIAQTRLDNHIM